MKKTLIWLGRSLVTLLLLAVLSIALAHTTWGFAVAKSYVLPSLSRSVFAGELEVGELTGFLGSDFSLSDVRLTDETGAPAYTIARLRVRWNLFALLTGRVEVQEVEIESPRVVLREAEGGGLAAIVEPGRPDSAPTADGPPSTPVPIVVESIQLGDGRFEMSKPEIRVEAIDLNGAFEFEGAALSARAERLRAMLTTKTPGRVALDGIYQLVEGEHRLTASATVAAARAQASGIRWDGETVPLGRLVAQLPRGFLQSWVGGPDLDVNLRAKSAPDPERPKGIAWKVNASAGDATLDATGRARGDGTEFRARIRDLSPRLFSNEIPEGQVSGRVEGRLLLQPLRGEIRSTATATLTVPRTRERVPLRTDFEAELERSGSARASLLVQGGGASVDLEAELGALLDSPNLRRLEASLRAPSLARLPIPGEPQGALELDGSWTEGRWSGRVEASNIRVADLDIRELTAEAFGRGLDLEGEVRARRLRMGRFRQAMTTLQVRPVGRGKRFTLTSTGTRPLRRVRLSGVGQIGWPLDVRLDEGQVVTGTSTWSFSPWRLRMNATRVRASGFEATTKRSQVEAEVDARWRPPFEGSAQLEAEMDELSDLAVLVPRLRGGTLRMSADARWDPSGVRGEASGNMEVQIASVEPLVAVRFKATSELEEVRVGGQVQADGLGRLALDAEASAPDSLAAWSDGPGWLERLSLLDGAVDEADLGAWASVIGAPTMTGVAQGSFRLRDEALDGRLRAESLQLPSMRAPLSLSAAAVGDGDRTAVQLELVADVPIVTASATVARSWRQLGRWPKAEMEASVLVDRVTMGRVASFVKLPEPFDAPVGGELEVRANLTRGEGKNSGHVTLRARAVEPYPASPRVDVDLDADLEDQAWTASATVAAEGLGRITTGVEGPRPPWIEPMPRRGVARLSGVQVTGLRALYRLPGLRQGRLDGQLRWSEGGDRGKASARLREARLFDGQPDFDVDLALEARPDAVDFELAAIDQALGLQGRFLRTSSDPLDWPVDARFGVQALPLKALVPVRAADSVDGSFTATATVGGTLSSPVARFGLDGRDAKVAEVRFDRAELRGRVQGSDLTLTASVAEATGGTLNLQARVGNDQLRSELTAQRLDLGFLSVPAGIVVGPVGSFDGRLSGRVEAAGPTDAPDVDGSLRIEDLQVVLPGRLPSIERGTAELDFHNGAFSVKTKGGSPAGGRFTLNADGDVEGPRIDGRFESTDLRYLAGPIVTEITTRTDFGLQGRDAQVILHRTKIALPEESSTSFHELGAPPDVVRVQTFGVRPKPEPPPQPPPPGAEAQLSLAIRNDEAITFRGVDAQGSAMVDLRVQEFGGVTRVNGETSVERGQIEVLGKTYQVERAVVSFTGNVPPNPRLDIQLAHSFDTLTLFVYITGPATKPQVRFGSSPGGYDEAQLTAFFTGLQNPDTPGRTSAEGSAASSIGQALLGPAIAEVRRQLPIDTLDIGSRGGAAVVTVGKWVSETVFVAAGYDGSRSGAGAYEGTLRWRFTPRWVLEVLASLETQSADVLWTKRF